MRTTDNGSGMRLLPLVLALSLTGCAATLPPQPGPVQLPQVQPPTAELMESPEPGSWSESVRQRLLKWRKLLTMPSES